MAHDQVVGAPHPDDVELKKKADQKAADAANPVLAVKRLGSEMQAAVRESFSKLPADFLVINDLTFEDIPATAISIQSEADVFIAETLRTQTATIEPKGRGNGLVSIQLVFQDGFEQQVKLRRLMAELLHNPFVFIENNKIRQTLRAPVGDDLLVGSFTSDTMAFVLHFGSLSISEQMPTVITVDLQFAEFNYKPFSHHFWYSSRIHGIEVQIDGDSVIVNGDRDKPKTRQQKIFPYEIGYESYDFSEQAMSSVLSETLDAMLEKTTQWGPINTPVVFPSQSPAFLYYAQHLESTMPLLGAYNSDYIQFQYNVYDVKDPPSDARSDTSTVKDFFGISTDSADNDPLQDRRLKTGDSPAKSAGNSAGIDSDAGKGTSGQKYVKDVVSSSGGGKLFNAIFRGGKRGSFQMTSEDRLWLARMLCGEMRLWKTSDTPEVRMRMTVMAWTMLNRHMVTGMSSFAHLLRKFSQPLMGKAFFHAYSHGGKLNADFNEQAINQYKAMTATWPGGDPPRKAGKGLSVIPKHVADFVNNFAAGNIEKPKNISGYIGNIDNYPAWGKLTKSAPHASGFWKQGASGEEWLFTNFAAEYFTFRSNAKGNYAKGQTIFRHGGNGDVYLRDAGHNETVVRSIHVEKTKNSDIPCDTVIYVTSSSMRVPDVWGASQKPSVAETEEQKAAVAASDSSTENDKQQKEQPNNDQATGEKEAPPSPPPDEVKAAKDAQARRERRIAWITEQELKGWLYYGENENFKNLFYRRELITIGGDPGTANSLPDVVATAASIQFGHRLAKHKLLGQEAPTWQFLGAGNKSGTIVLTAAGSAGRLALQRMKTMYATLNNNARNIDLIREASSARLEVRAPNSDETNNIFLLTKVENIVITNITDESIIQDGVDVYRMTVEFLAQDFPESSFVPRDFIGLETKNSMMAKMIKDLQHTDRSPTPSGKFIRGGSTLSDRAKVFFYKMKVLYNHFHPLQCFAMSAKAIDEEADRATWLVDMSNLLLQLEMKSQFHVVHPSKSIARWDDVEQKMVPSGNVPQWYIDLLADLAAKFKNISLQFPILNLYTNNADYMSHTGSVLEQNEMIKQQANSSETWEERIRKHGNSLGGVGDNLVEIIGGKGIETPSGSLIKGYVLPAEVVAGNRIQTLLYDQIGRYLNQFVQRALTMAADKEGFVSAFSQTIYDDVIGSVMSDFGECYKDLNLPMVPTTNIPVVPEFYLYDDALENASLTQLTTGTGSLAEAIKRHVTNQVSSNQKFISGRMMGGLQVSKNAPLISNIRYKYGGAFSGEQRFMGATGGFAGMNFALDKRTAIEEALRIYDVVGYQLAEEEQQGDQDFIDLLKAFTPANNEWTKFQKYGVSATQNNTQAFLTAVVASAGLSEYNNFSDVIQGQNDRSSVYKYLREFYFKEETGKLPTRILRGPSVLNSAVDDTWSGKITLEQVADLGEIPPGKESENSLVPSGHQGDAQTFQDGACVSSSQVEQDAAIEEDLQVPVQGETKDTAEGHEMAKLIDVEAKTVESESRYVKAKAELAKRDPMLEAESLAMAGTAPLSEAAQEEEKAASQQLKQNLAKLYDIVKDVNTMDKQATRIIREATQRVKKDISLRRAYPTFKIYFIDQDSEIDGLGYQAFDDFYSYSSIQEIRVTRSHKIAADMAVIRITDVARKLTLGRFSGTEIDEKDLQREDPLGWWAETLKENPFNGGILQEGVKVQIRLGYSNAPDELETVFLGQIVEICPSSDSKILEIVCQGYGAELEAANMDSPEDEIVYYSSQHALSCAIMQPYIKNFGHWRFNQEYNPAEIRNRYQKGGESPFEFTFLQDHMRDLSFRKIRFQNFRNNPEDDNIFAPPPWTYADAWDRFWNNMVAFRPLMMTPWEVFKEHELRHPGYVAMALPYGHEPRMTMFFGARGQNYWCRPPSRKEIGLARYWSAMVQRYGGTNILDMHNDDTFKNGLLYLRKKNPEFFNAFISSLMPNNFQGIGYYLGGVHGRYRPFRNYHIFTSEHHIIQNEIRSSMSNSFNAVEIRYSNSDDSLDGDDPEEILEDISEVKKEGGILTVQLNDNIPENQIRTYEDFFPSCITETMARRYAQGLLLRGVRETYTGSLTVTGEETLKPYDIVMVRDHITDMYGPIEVESVTHIFNRDTGFVSVITPNMCVDANDWFAKGWMDTTLHTLSLVYEVAERQKVMNRFRQNPVSVGGTFDNLLATMAAFQIIHWDQTASPVCITPVMHGGKPLVSVTTAPKFASVFSNIWGKWHQWWEDFRVGLSLGGISEEMAYHKDDLFNTLMGFVDASQGGSRKEKGEE